MNNFITSLKKWFLKGSWSIVDQALYAGTHFIISIFLARYLEQKAFGIFAFIYSIYVLIQMAYRAFWYAPMLFYGAKKYKEYFKSYNLLLAKYHWVLSFFIGLILASVVLVFSVIEIEFDVFLLIAVFVSFSSMLYLLFYRRSCYVVLKPHISCLGSFLYLIIVFSSLGFLKASNSLTLTNAFWVLAFGSLSSSFFVRYFILNKENNLKELKVKNISVDHWKYGKWLFGAAIVTWLSGEVFYSMLISFGHTTDSGTLKALMNIVKPIFHVNLGLSALLIPAFVRSNDSGNKKSSLLSSLFTMGGIATLYTVIMIWFGDSILILLYGSNSPYIEYFKWLIILSSLPILHTLITIFGGWLQAIDETKKFAIAYGFSAIVAVFIGFYLIPKQGIGGAVIGLVGSHIATAMVLIYFTYSSRIRKAFR